MLYPGSIIDRNLLKEFINLVYWPIYGEMTFKEILNDDKQIFSQEAIIYGYIATIIYVCIVNILLINILIAIFRLYYRLHIYIAYIYNYIII